MISYQISLIHPESHQIDVVLSIKSALVKGQEFWLPDWIPGSYMIRDFARNITSIFAFEQGNPVALTKLDKSTWCLDENVEGLEIRYKVYAWDLSVRAAHFDDQHCFFNGTSILLALKGAENQQHEIELLKPSHPCSVDWSVATTLKIRTVDSNGFGRYFADNYADAIDHPFEVAELDKVEFIVAGVTHRMVFTESPENIDYVRIAKDVAAICALECDFFADDKPPFKQYLFMTFVQKSGFGGLEHRSSTALQCSHADLPKIGDPEKKSEDYQRFLSLCSHEYFHSWNVKRIKPKVFEDYALRGEVHSEQLWFFEGITSYYDELFLVRSGVISPSDYLNMIAKNITRYLRGSGRHKQTIAESSFDAWTKFYKQDENAVNSIVSYYVKGGLIAFCLDFEIRQLTKNKQSLDDLMRLIWTKHGKTNKGLEDKKIQTLAESLTNQSMEAFFNHHLYSTAELALIPLFQKLGIELQLLPAKKSLESGGFRKSTIKRNPIPSLGIVHKSDNGGVGVSSVLENSSASVAGLSNKDIIIAIDDYRVKASEIDQLIASKPIGSNIKLSFFRRDKLHHRVCELQAAQDSVCYLSFGKEKKNELLCQWLHIDSHELPS